MCCPGGISLVVWRVGVPSQCQGLGHVCSTRYSSLTRQEERPCVPVPKGTGEHQALGRDFQVSAQCLQMYLGPRDAVPAIWQLLHLTLSSFPLFSSSLPHLHPTKVLGALGPRHILISSYLALCLKHPSHILYPPAPPHFPSSPSLGPMLWVPKEPSANLLYNLFHTWLILPVTCVSAP